MAGCWRRCGSPSRIPGQVVHARPRRAGVAGSRQPTATPAPTHDAAGAARGRGRADRRPRDRALLGRAPAGDGDWTRVACPVRADAVAADAAPSNCPIRAMRSRRHHGRPPAQRPGSAERCRGIEYALAEFFQGAARVVVRDGFVHRLDVARVVVALRRLDDRELLDHVRVAATERRACAALHLLDVRQQPAPRRGMRLQRELLCQRLSGCIRDT